MWMKRIIHKIICGHGSSFMLVIENRDFNNLVCLVTESIYFYTSCHLKTIFVQYFLEMSIYY